MPPSRRQLLVAALGVAATLPLGAPSPAPTGSRSRFAALESRYGARLGVAAVEVGGRRSVTWRADERFPFCSTYKALAGAAILRRDLPLDRVVHYTGADLVDYSPVTSQHVDDGMTLAAIAEAAIRQSDNTAGNLLFQALGGPGGFQRDLRRLGDQVTISSRLETDLNSAVPGDRRDTSTPCALARDLATLVGGKGLRRDDRARLIEWMSGNATGDPLIRAGLPQGWTVADKSGAGSYGTRNDIGVATPPTGRPIAIVVLSTRSAADATYDNALVAEAARAAIGAWA